MRRVCGMLAMATIATATIGLGAACGSSAASSGPALTKAELVSHANAICANYGAQREKLAKSLDLSKDDLPHSADLLVKNIIPLQRKQIEEFKKLSPPKDLQQQFNDLLKDVNAATDDLEHTLETDPAKALSGGYNPFARANQDAVALGFRQCASTS
jgi:hypothetical protein